MGPFWSSFFDQLKDCGRNATLFLVVMLGFVILLVACVAIWGNVPHEYLVGGLWVILLVAVVWAGVGIYRGLTRRREALRFPMLSRDELRVARSKLMKGRNVRGNERNDETYARGRWKT